MTKIYGRILKISSLWDLENQNHEAIYHRNHQEQQKLGNTGEPMEKKELLLC